MMWPAVKVLWPQRAQQSLARSGTKLLTVIVDRAPTHMDRETPAICGDALALPFRDNSFDVVGSPSFCITWSLRRLSNFVREGLRVARHAFLIHDLRAPSAAPGAQLPGHCRFIAAASPGMTRLHPFAGLTLGLR